MASAARARLAARVKPLRAARAEIVIAVAGPGDRNVRRQRIAFHLGASAERIALALHDQRRAAQILQMRGAQVLRFVRRMERVAEAHQPVDQVAGEQLIGGEAGDASAHRLAADE